MKTHLVVLLALVVVGSFRSVVAADAPPNPPYLSEMPSVARLLDDMKIDDEHMTTARRLAALETLCDFIKDMAGPRAERDGPTEDEQRILKEYTDAYDAILKPMDTPMAKLPILGMTVNVLKGDFPDWLRAKYFSADVLAQYRKAVGRADDPARPATPAPPAAAPPGPSPLKPLRMSGTYVGDNALRIDFQSDAAAITIGESKGSAAYTVDVTDNKAVVTLFVREGAVRLTLGVDGNLVGSNYQSTNAAGQVERHNLGVLKPGAMLSLTASVDAQANPIKPIANHEFYLLRDSLDDALTKGGFKPPSGMTPRNAMEYARIHETPDHDKALNAMSADIVATITTDAAGRAQFPPLPPGVYWLVGGIFDPRLGWNLKVELKPGASAVTIDLHNASPFQ